MKKHDPEASAAAYLAGVTSRRARRRFETHILECEECWREVHLGGLGRGLAESARELAPQTLRERVRGTVSLLPAPRVPRRRRVGLVSLLVVATVAATFLAVRVVVPEQPRLIQTLLTHFERGRPSGEVATPELPPQLGDLRLVKSESLRVGGERIHAQRYRDPAGHQVVVYRSTRTFPMAAGARRHGAIWEATADGMVMFCADRPAPSLVAGDDRGEVRLVVRLLGLS
jgi:hypothetical protein